MNVIEDRYKFDFDTAQSTQEINKLIDALKEYNKLGEKASDNSKSIINSNGGIAASSRQLQNILNQEATTTDGLKAKIAALVRVQGQLAIGSKARVEVTNRITATTKELNVAMGQAEVTTQSFSNRLASAVGGFQGLIGAGAGVAGVGVLLSSINDRVGELDARVNSVRTSTQGLSSDTAENLTGDILASSQTFSGVDADEQLNVIKTAANEFNKDAARVFDELQVGLVRATTEQARTEVLENLKEYSTFFNQAGLSLAQSIGVINLGDQLGVYNDKAADAVKEVTIRLSEATKVTVEGVTNAFGETFSNSLFEDLNSGALSTFDALQLISAEAQRVDLNPQQYGELVAAIGGGALEDAGQGFFNALKDIDTQSNSTVQSLNAYQQKQLELLEINRETSRLQVEVASQLTDTSREYDTARAKIRLFLNQGALRVLEFFQVLPRFVRENKAEIAGFAASIAILNVGKAVTSFKSLVDILKAVTIQQRILNLVARANPYVLLASAVVATASALSIYAKSASAAGRQQDFVQEKTKSLAKEFTNEKSQLDSLFVSLAKTNEGSKERAAAIDAINNKYGEYLPNLLTEKSTTDEVTSAYKLLNEAILDGILKRAQAAAAEEIFDNIIQNQLELNRIQKDGLSITEQARDGLIAIASTPFAFGGIGRFIDGTAEGIAKEIDASKQELDSLPESFELVKQRLQDILGSTDLSGLFSTAGATDALPSTVTDVKANIEVTGKEEAKVEVEEVAGSLAFLRSKLAELNKDLESGTSLGDTEAIKSLQDRIAAQIKLIEEGEARLEQLKSNRQATQPLAPLDTLDTPGEVESTDSGLDRVVADLDREIIAREIALAERLEIVERENLSVEEKAKERERLETESAIKIAEIKEQIAQASLAEAETQDDSLGLKKEIAELDLLLAELGQKEVEIEVGIKVPPDINQLVTDSLETLFSVADTFASITNNRLSSVVDNQRSVLDNMLSNSEDFNARQIEIEKDRLLQVEAQQRKAAKNAANINAIELGATSALAIAKQATLPFPGNLVAIAGTIAALVSGIAQIRSSVAGFQYGTKYVQRGNNPVGRDTIPANLDEGEAVIPRETNAEYAYSVGAIFDKTIPAGVLKDFIKSWRSGSISSIGSMAPRDVSQQAAAVGVGVYTQQNIVDTSKTENLLKEGNQLLKNQRKVRNTPIAHPKARRRRR